MAIQTGIEWDHQTEAPYVKISEKRFDAPIRGKKLSSIISAALFVVFASMVSNAHAAQVQLAWDPNSEPDLAGYKLYFGQSSRNYQFVVDVGNETTYSLLGLTEDETYYFAATAYDFSENESDFSNEVSLTAAPAIVPEIIHPHQGARLTGATVSFDWTANGTPVTEWWLHVGSSLGAYDLFNSRSLGTSTSTTVSTLPVNGSQFFVRLYFKVSGSWQSVDFQYTAADLIPKITTPVPGGTLTSFTVTFTGAHDATHLQHWLQVGTSQGADNIFSQDMGTQHQITVAPLPATGTIHVRYWTKFPHAWEKTDQTYTMNVVLPAITTPAPGGTLTGASVTFQWTANGQPVTEWWLCVETGPGKCDIFNSRSLGTSTSTTVSTLPVNGSQFFVRLWFKVGGVWLNRDFQYTAATIGTMSLSLSSIAKGIHS